MEQDEVAYSSPAIFNGKLLYNSKVYYREKKLPSGTTYWICKTKSCPARLHWKHSGEIEFVRGHVCPTSAVDCQYEELWDELKRYATVNNTVPPSKVLSTVLTNYSPNVLEKLPTDDVISRSIRRWRQKEPPRVKKRIWGKQILLVDNDRRAKDEALEKLRELAISAEDGTKPMEIVQKVLREMPQESLHVMPSEDALIVRVRRWMRTKGERSSSSKMSLQDWAEYGGQDNDDDEVARDIKTKPPSNPTPSSSSLHKTYIVPPPQETISEESVIDENVVVGSGKINFEPVTITQMIDPETGETKPRPGLVFLKQKIDGHNRAMFGGQIFGWSKDIQKDVLLYACREEKRGCKAHVILYMKQKRYVVKGGHYHDYSYSRKNSQAALAKKRCVPNLKLVDDDGNEIRGATMDDVFSENLFENTAEKSESGPATTSDVIQSAKEFLDSTSLHNEASADDDFMDDGGGGEDFQMDNFDDTQEETPQTPTAHDIKRENLPCPASKKPGVRSAAAPTFKEKLVSSASEFKTLSSAWTSNGRAKSPRKDPNARKTGEPCCVCGDELIYSEKLACNEETFRKACCYLNVRSEREWFPKSGDGQFYSFCGFCSKEIMRIHDLYKKVEEIQSMIFRKVEGVEKRVVDAQIVDAWMSETTSSTVLRYEGFRKQVLTNYRNKLKLRREVREGQKIGQNLSEAQPVVTARMFVSNPAETVAYRKAVSDGNEVGQLDSRSQQEQDNEPPPKRTRGRPKSKKTNEVNQSSRSQSRSRHLSSKMNLTEPDQTHEDVGFQDYEDDAKSIISEKEVKFWHEDPRKLRIGDAATSQEDDDVDDNFDTDFGGGNDDDFGGGAEIHDENVDEISDPDYSEDDDDDDEWTSCGSKRKKSKQTRKSRRLAKKLPVVMATTSLEQSKLPSTEKTRAEKPVPKEKPFPQEPTNEDKPTSSAASTTRKKKPHVPVKFPDTILRRDGRIFMQGVEIIKNPPGHWPSRPYSVSFTCGACGKIVLSFWHVRRHICGLHLGMYKCNICQKQYSEPRMVERHMEEQHKEGPKTTNCFICEKPFKREQSMLYHVWTHLSEEEKKDPENAKYKPRHELAKPKGSTMWQTFMCSYCSKTFQRAASLQQHELSHTGEAAPMQCQYCGKLFSGLQARKNLWQHVSKCSKKFLGVVDMQTYPCSKCPVRFKSRQTRSKHMRRFHRNATSSNLPFSCPKCPRAFSTKSAFKNHRRVCLEGGTKQREVMEHEFKTDTNEMAQDSQSQSYSNPDASSSGRIDPSSLAGYSHMFGYQGM